jgi:short-subunit dehydrogenase
VDCDSIAAILTALLTCPAHRHTASIALTSSPYTGAYAANKGFQICLGEASWYELLGSGVDALVMVAGLMNTQGDAFAMYTQWLVSEPDAVVRRVLTAVGRKHGIVRVFPTACSRGA